MFDDDKLAALAKVDGNGEALCEIGNELIQSEYRIGRVLGSLQRALNDIELAVREGRETNALNGLNGNELIGLVESLGERSALIRAMKRLGVDISKL